MTIMEISLASIVALIAIGAFLHIWNMCHINMELEKDRGGGEKIEISLSGIKKAISRGVFIPRGLFIPQGSVFNGMALSAWILAFVAFGYLYFLTPLVVPDYNLFQISSLASWSFGFITFGLFLVVFGVLFILATNKLPDGYCCIRLTELYGYYFLSKMHKRAIASTIPLLWISIFISVHLGTIYPLASGVLSVIAYLLLLASVIILISPIIKQSMEGVF
ncbi:MAG: Uncharacterized protein XD72_2227 [Methanothrix harundinacea]|jgi:hypothetical protein|uniref:Uncharacterized protein n=1 Tax=Methanothrix harundinacea TaxID=301375 RepID=A0A101FS00_9EURY|nr:MAG: Uncharacterized protein XD72_2227 [Methanothrix harundinacea]